MSHAVKYDPVTANYCRIEIMNRLKAKHYQLKYTQDVETSHSVSLYINVENNVVPYI